MARDGLSVRDRSDSVVPMVASVAPFSNPPSGPWQVFHHLAVALALRSALRSGSYLDREVATAAGA